MEKRCYITQVVTRTQKEEDGSVSTFHEPEIFAALQARDPKLGFYRMVGSHVNNDDGSPSTSWAVTEVETDDHTDLVAQFKSFPVDQQPVNKSNVDLAIAATPVTAAVTDTHDDVVGKLQEAQFAAIITNVVKI